MISECVQRMPCGPCSTTTKRLSCTERWGADARSAERKNPVGVTMNHQRGNINLCEVSAEIRFPGIHAVAQGNGGGRGRHVPALLQCLAADSLTVPDIGIVEILQVFGQKSESVGRQAPFGVGKKAFVQTVWVILSFEQVWRHGRDKHGLTDPCRPIGPEVPSHLPAAHRAADQCAVVQIEPRDKRVQIGGEGVILIADSGMVRLAEAPAVISDDPVPGMEQGRRLLFPGGAA